MVIVGNCEIMQAVCLCMEFSVGATFATPTFIPHGGSLMKKRGWQCMQLTSADTVQSCKETHAHKCCLQYTALIIFPNQNQIVDKCALYSQLYVAFPLRESNKRCRGKEKERQRKAFYF